MYTSCVSATYTYTHMCEYTMLQGCGQSPLIFLLIKKTLKVKTLGPYYAQVQHMLFLGRALAL